MTTNRRQRGATLLVTLVLLVLIGLAAMVSYGSSMRNVKVVGNMQMRSEAVAAAQRVVEDTLSDSVFTREPLAVAADPKPVDIDGDGSPDYTVMLQPAPRCIRQRPVRGAELDPTRSENLPCLGSAGAELASDGSGAASGALCREVTWEIAAAVDDRTTGARATLRQGASIRISAADAANACP